MASAGTAPARIAQPQSAIVVAKPSLLMRISTGPSCFYWIAGLTVINSVAVILNRPLHFVVGLGITSVVDNQAKHLGVVGLALDLLINGTIAGIFFLLGNLSGKSIRWAFVVGMVLYGLDGLLLLAANDILSVVFHASTIFAISRGLATLNHPKTERRASPPVPSTKLKAAQEAACLF